MNQSSTAVHSAGQLDAAILRRGFPHEVCIHTLFKAQTGRTPDAVALVFEKEHLTFRELERRANQVAHFIQKLGAGPDVLVGISVERSPDMVVGILGILKAGGAYLPLDPTYPQDRLAFIVADSQTKLLLAQQRPLERLPKHDVRVVCMDSEQDARAIARQSGEKPDEQVTAQHLAYVIYTSGSTGRPKGVLIPHQALVNHSTAIAGRYGLEPTDRILQFASISFDVAAEELFPPLLSGATVVLRSEHALASFDDLIKLAYDQKLTVLNLPTAYWHAWVSDLSRSGAQLPPSLRLVIVGGEQAWPERLTTWQKLAGDQVRWYNAYGLSEATITNTLYEPIADATVDCVPIGRPIANTQMYLLDAQQRPVPVGMPGEIYIGGLCLARGYLDRPDLSAEKFIPDPFGDEPGARLYKTGDMGRYRTDGNVEFLGRLDQQVKVRGFRIELGEIEAALNQHPAVKTAIVLAREDIASARDKRLVAYLVTEPESTITISALRRYLQEKLLDFMIPAAFVQLDVVPLTPSGKIDRRALPAPQPERPALAEPFVAPRGPVEETLASIWSDVLHLGTVSVHDNFFELGGQSLLAMQIVSRLDQVLQVEIPLSLLFERPTIAGLAREIIRREQTERAHIPLQPVVKEGAVPLSFAQQRLWFMDQLLPGSPLYNVPAVFHITGQLEEVVLKRCLDEIVRRHAALRTTFHELDGQPVQTVSPPRPIELTLADLRPLPVQERQSQARRVMHEQARRPFDLVRGPLLRVVLIQLDDRAYRLLLTLHHIATDGWSFGVIMDELETLYAAFAQGQPAPLPELPLQYADYARWQCQYLQGRVLAQHLDYWKARFADSQPVLALPTDRPRPAVQTYQGAKQSLPLSTTLVESLQALSRQENASLFMTMLAAFQTLLHRYSGATDVIVGVPLANRTRPEIEGLIGFFVNTLPLRVDLSGDPTLRELIGRVRKVALEAYAHQDLPLEKLVEALDLERDLGYNPLFQVMFVMQNMPVYTTRLPDVQINFAAELSTGTAKFDLTLFVEFPAQGPHVIIEYNTDLFEASTIRRMLGHFQSLLEGMAANPDARVVELPLLTPAERRQLLVTWNETGVIFPHAMCVHNLFEAQASHTPDAVALVYQREQITYQELNRRANQLAHHLQELEVEPEARVGICVERSPEMVVGLLGILKAGGAYVPLDPAYPRQRLAFMLEDTQVRVTLTQERLAANLPADGRVICLDADWQTIAQESDENAVSGVKPEHLAYVMYTSGSTGRPKGVMIPHRGLVNYLSWCQRAYPLAAGRGALVHSSLSFDLTVTSLFAPLLAGRAALLLPEEPGLEALAGALRDETHFSLLKITPTHLELLNRQLLPEEMAGRTQALVIGGENLPAAKIALWQDHAPDTALINEYGPTEAVVGCCVYAVPKGARRAESVPIGRPIMNAQLHLLDAHLQPAPIGVAGELYIGGACLGRGYLKRPDLTAERFVPHPFSAGPAARLYKTGDVARYLPDGNIEFLGRSDQQVKVRGFRIELGEIEALLARHPSVNTVVVVAREDASSSKHLVAYYVAGQEPVPTAGELRRHLQAKLPDYMIPAAFVRLDAMPLTPNGKVDRRALPAPQGTRPELETTFVAPRNSSEKIVAGIWSRVLGIERVGVHDSFFALGGHSLLATQVMSRVRDTFQVELALREMFATPTVASLVRRIEAARQTKWDPITPVARDGAPLLSLTQQRLWFLDQLDPHSSVYNVPEALRLVGPLNVVALRQSLDEIGRRHETLRTTFATVNGQPVQVIAPGSALPLLVADLQELPLSKREGYARRLIGAQVRQPFDLTRGPLVRAILVQLQDQEHVLLLNMHHIISDGWSMGVLIQELAALYTAFSVAEPSRQVGRKQSPLADLPVQYADFAHWQREWLQGEVLETQLSYWKQQLGGRLPVLDLPTDQPWSALQTTLGASQILLLSHSLTCALKALSQQEGVTLFMTLLAAFKTLLHRYTQQQDVIVGTPVAGRNRRELEDLIGFFLNTLALRTFVSGTLSFRELLGRVRQVVLAAYTHQDLPFEKLVQELQPARDLSRNPFFDVMLNLDNTPFVAPEIPGLRCSFLELDEPESKFAMTLYAREQDGRLYLQLVYRRGLFSAERMAALLEQLAYLLEQIVAAPEHSIRDYSLVTPASRTLLPDPSVALPEPRYELITAALASLAERIPQQTAVCQGDQCWTYGELAKRALVIAQALRERGLERGDVVAVWGARSFGLIASMLGVFFSGGVLLAVDPLLPNQRQRTMLHEAQARYLLLVQPQRSQETPLQANQSLAALPVDPDSGQILHALVPLDKAPELQACSYDDPAYLFFTSGTTGVPKGVLGCHKGLAHFLAWQRATFEIGPHDRCAQLTALSFDVVLRDIFTPLTSGATLCLPEDDGYDPGRVIPWLEREKISVLHTVPAIMQAWLADVPSGFALRHLSWIFSAGEPLKETLVRRWRATFPEAGEIVNLYGPTETTLAKCFYLLPADLLPGVQPVGAPLPATQALILADGDRLCGVGEVGEIVIRTPFRSLGYVNAAQDQHKRFVKNPLRDDEKDLLYYTGDRGRYRPDGMLEILGRLDQQVKMRGMRVELGEIESTLTRHPTVREAVVLAFDGQGDLDEKYLAAYVVADREQTPAGDELRRFLRQRLPEYMIPSAFVALNALPLTANGKVDRQALPAPAREQVQRESDFVAPRTPFEEILAQVWQEVLKLERISVHDDFFALGGHSLLATQMISRVRDRFEIDLPLRCVFETPTIAELGSQVERILVEEIEALAQEETEPPLEKQE